MKAEDLLYKRTAVSEEIKLIGGRFFENRLAMALEGNPGVGMTTDMWTEDHTRAAYLAITLHAWVISAPTLLTVTLQNDEFPRERHTGPNISVVIEKALAPVMGTAQPLKKVVGVTGEGILLSYLLTLLTSSFMYSCVINLKCQ